MVAKGLPHIGIVGHESAKFTPTTEAIARKHIRDLLGQPCVVVSGRCPLGGIDIWAEEEGKALGRVGKIFPPKTKSWSTGYKPRNLAIARVSDIVWVLVVRELPPAYKGMRFEYCYHCKVDTHVKSGGCWTARQAQLLGKEARWIEI